MFDFFLFFSFLYFFIYKLTRNNTCTLVNKSRKACFFCYFIRHKKGKQGERNRKRQIFTQEDLSKKRGGGALKREKGTTAPDTTIFLVLLFFIVVKFGLHSFFYSKQKKNVLKKPFSCIFLCYRRRQENKKNCDVIYPHNLSSFTRTSEI